MSESKSDTALLKALDEFEAHGRAHSKEAIVGAKHVNICETYKLVKPVLSGILPFLGLIPIIGHRVVPAIQALLAALDVFCPPVYVEQ